MPLHLRRILLASVFFIGLPCSLNGAPSPADISVRTIGHGLLVAPVSINGQGPFDFVIDTGTNTTLIDPALAARLGLASEGVENLKTLTGLALVPRFRVASLAVGSKEVSNLLALGQPMSAVQKLDKRINGIVGLEFLAHFSFGLDYAHLRLRLYDADAPLKVNGGARIPARLICERLLLAVVFASPATVEDAEKARGVGRRASASQDSRATPERRWTLVLDSGIAQIFLFAQRAPTELPESAPANECFSAIDPHPVCRSEASEAAVQEHSAGLAANPSVRVTTNQSQTLGRLIVLQRMAIGEVQFRNMPAVLLRMEGSVGPSLVDGLLPACLLRSFLYDHATSTILLNPD